MSEPKCIAPLLENFIMGESISDHSGVRSCPAMENDTQRKCIVKILSFPASQVQLDALLLTGVCADEESAKSYFKEQAESTVAEAELLQKLAGVEGFVGFSDWQIEPMEDAIGFDLYLLSDYRPTLERYLARNPMTHCGAVSLGLDLCAALSVCRQNGYLYVALKPGNIYHMNNGDYRIGDLGFIPMDSLKFASLPDKYRSAYTPPEITDAYSALNETLDTYAVGSILYQVYNNGQLPQYGDDGTFIPPEYADYEMAEIILKAVDPDPQARYQTPAELGQTLVAYIQRNGISDTPIVPLPVSEEIESVEQGETAVSDLVEEDLEQIDAILDNEEGIDQIAFSLTDETEPNEEVVQELEETEVTEEVSEMLAQADDLIAHETPDPVVAPDPIDVPIPEPLTVDTPAEEADTQTEEIIQEEEAEKPAEEVEAAEEVPAEALEDDDVITEYIEPEIKNRKYTGLIVTLCIVLILLVLGIGALIFYENYYLQTIDDLTLKGAEDYLTVTLDTDIDNDLLTVVCTDTHGNALRQGVKNGTAHFTALAPDTQYKITVEISGFHELAGTTTDSYQTDCRTEIVSFSAVTGDEDGSVILSFVLQGTEETAWRVIYATEDEEEQTKEFTGRMMTINGLTVGKTYTFHLEPVAQIYVVGNDTIEHTASNLIFCEDLKVLGFEDGKLNATWKAPENITVESWTVRCYDDAGYDNTIVVTEPSVSIDGLSMDSAYTLDVNVTGMSLGKRVFVSAGSVTVSELNFEASAAGQLTVSWSYEGPQVEEGWMLLYTIDGGESQVVHCTNSTSAVIPSVIPGGVYDFSVQPPYGATVFGGKGSYTVPGGGTFNDYGTKADRISLRMCPTPKETGWHWYNLWDKDFTTEFKVGQKASFVTHAEGNYKQSDDVIDVLFVIKDSAGTPMSMERSSRPWSGMFTEGYGELDVPTMPAKPGEYTVDIYFNNAFVATQAFTVIK